MGRRKPDGHLVDGVYDPTYRSAKLERYAQLGHRRAHRVIRGLLADLSRWQRMDMPSDDLASKLLTALIEARCVALVSAGVDEENEQNAREIADRRPAAPPLGK
jgi:hypothetical protein